MKLIKSTNTFSLCRRGSSNLPKAMRYRTLKETYKEMAGVYRSHIHGRGLFCNRDIEAGECQYAMFELSSNTGWSLILYFELLFCRWNGDWVCGWIDSGWTDDGQARKILWRTRHRLLHVQNRWEHRSGCNVTRQCRPVYQSCVWGEWRRYT